MENNKQTAVEWLIKQLKSRYGIYIERLTVTDQAKQMEKQQIIESYKKAQALMVMDSSKQAEQYYNEEYGSNNEQQ